MSQNNKILSHLKSGYPLTPKDAQELFGVYRLSARVYDLTQKGHPIVSARKTVITRNGNTIVAEYRYAS